MQASMRSRTVFVVLLASALATVANTQSKPNFSGRWTQTNPAANQPAFTMEVMQDGRTITVATLGGRDNPRFVLNLDGTESTHGTEVITAQWQGNQLVIAVQADSVPHGSITIKQTWAVEAEMLVIDEVIVSRTTGATLSGPDKKTYRKSQRFVDPSGRRFPQQ